ncbi:hypothetical protein P43SY_008500 [Pythium insidiosum]|uniref:Calcineurin-like phosphoesterase n=1 Tax=Pythium insidiosum TaxID=114742 RepID=A0AAD5QEV4_PYTIN|nr:hypothetical protein P43SY_008500 [Pythium insidiosum]
MADAREEERLEAELWGFVRGEERAKHRDPRDQHAHLVVLSVNDVHDMLPGRDGRGGISGLATLLDRERATLTNDQTLLVTLNGDFLNGTEVSERLLGEHAIELMDHVGIQYVVVGNHEFDFGERVMRQRLAASRFKWLGANIIDRSTGLLLDGLLPVDVLELQGGLRLGLLGVCTPDTPTSSSPGDNIEFRDTVATAIECVRVLRERHRVDFIVALTHLRIREDRQLARAVPEIDVILGGHDHEPHTVYEGRTLIHKSGQNAHWLARLDFQLTRSAVHPERPVAVMAQWRMIANEQIPSQPACDEILVKYLRRLAAEDRASDLDRELAVVKRPLATSTVLLRSGECNMGNLVADALRAVLHADLGFINGGFIRGDSLYDDGDVLTPRVLNHEMPFPRAAVVLRIKIRDLGDALRQQLARYPQVSSTHPHISGFRLTVDRRVEAEPAVLCITRHGGQCDDGEELVTVATTEFVANGGDGCTAWRQGELVSRHARVTDVVAQFLTTLREVAYPTHEGRITILE